MLLVSIFLSTRKQGCACTQITDRKPRKKSSLYITRSSPVIILVGRARAGSSARADSWRCSPGSGGPARRAGTPRPGSLGCSGGSTDSFQESQNDFSGAHHGQSFLLAPRVLEKRLFQPTVRYLTRANVRNNRFYNDLIAAPTGTAAGVAETTFPLQTSKCGVFFYPFAPVPAAGPLAWPKYPGGGMGGMTRLKGMGMFMAVTWLGPALIIPIWSCV